MKQTPLPPLKSILAFEAAAQKGSFSAAAEQLFVTPAAISQQIRLLEQHLNLDLFTRSKTGVQLTAAGLHYLHSINMGLEALRQGQKQLDSFRQQHIITITALSSVASKWLMPRVLQWMDMHPGTEIRVVASHAKVDFSQSASDMCISFGKQGYQTFNNQLLYTDKVSLVASPGLLQQLADPEDLLAVIQLPKITIDWGHENRDLPDWNSWYEAANLGAPENITGPHFNLSSMAIAAAAQGQGLLLGQHSFIEQELQSKALIQVSDIALPLRQSYYLNYPNRSLDKPEVMAFAQWLKLSSNIPPRTQYKTSSAALLN